MAAKHIVHSNIINNIYIYIYIIYIIYIYIHTLSANNSYSFAIKFTRLIPGNICLFVCNMDVIALSLSLWHYCTFVPPFFYWWFIMKKRGLTLTVTLLLRGAEGLRGYECAIAPNACWRLCILGIDSAQCPTCWKSHVNNKLVITNCQPLLPEKITPK